MNVKQRLVNALKQHLLGGGLHGGINSGGGGHGPGGHIAGGGGSSPGPTGGPGDSQEGGPQSTFLPGVGKVPGGPGVGEDKSYAPEIRTSALSEAGARAWALAHPRKFLAMQAGAGSASGRWQFAGPHQSEANDAFLAKLRALAGPSPVAPKYKNADSHAWKVATDAREQAFNSYIEAHRGTPGALAEAQAAGQAAFDGLYQTTLAQLRAAKKRK